MKLETMLKAARNESPGFGSYADYFLSEVPDINMPTLRDLYKHNATPTEYRRHMARIKNGSVTNEAKST